MRVLVIGYGNPSRQDDGVGLAVVNGLRGRAGRRPLDEGEDGYEELGQDVDTLFLQQLNPELAELIAEYDEMVLVDAHFGAYEELVHRTVLEPQVTPAIVSHHFRPETLLAIARELYGHAPRAELLSVRGFSFDFTSEFSPATAEGVAQVVDMLWQRLRSDIGG